MSEAEVARALELYRGTTEQVIRYMVHNAGHPQRVEMARDILDAKTAEANLQAAEASRDAVLAVRDDLAEAKRLGDLTRMMVWATFGMALMCSTAATVVRSYQRP